MPKELLISRCQQKNNQVIWLLIAAPIGVAVGLARRPEKLGWHSVWSALGVLAFYGALVGMLLWLQAKARRRRIVIDPAKETIGVEFFLFTTSFWPEKARPLEKIRFSEIVDARYKPPQGKAPGHLLVRTTKGRVSIPETMEHFATLQMLIEEMAATNATHPTEHLRNLTLEPSIDTPWYGWLLLIAPVAGILWLCWKAFNAR